MLSVSHGGFLKAYFQLHSLWYGYLYTVDLLWTYKFVLLLLLLLLDVHLYEISNFMLN
jgi:hypothetical protein